MVSYNIFINFIQKMRELKNDDEIYYELEKTAVEWEEKSIKIAEKKAKIIKNSLEALNKAKGVPKKY